MSPQLQTQTKAAPQPFFTPVQTGLLQRKCACGQHTVAGGECAECRQKREGMMQRAATSAAPVSTVPPIVHDVLGSSGQPLDAGTRAFMEPRFGHDFSQVLVHTDAKAAESTEAVNALAYTVGRDVVFGSGQYRPAMSEGQRLFAHELTHVVQQSGLGDKSRVQRRLEVSHPNDTSEQEAEARAADVVEGHAMDGMQAQRQLGAARLQRQIGISQAPPGLPGPSPVPGPTPPASSPTPPTTEQTVDIRKIELVVGSRREHIDPSKVTQGLWWFNGGKPTFSMFYDEEADLDLGEPASGRFQYKITKGSDKLVLLDGTRETTSLDVMDNTTLKVKSKGASKAAKDIQVSITHTPHGSKSSKTITIGLEVRAPHHLDLLGCSHAAKGSYGYDTTFQMRVRDNFGIPVAYIDINEDFDSGTLSPGATSEWSEALRAKKKGSAITLGDGYFEDQYSAEVSGGAPPAGMSPQPSNPQSPLGSTLAATFTHEWYVGSQNTGQGVHVSTHLGKLYSDHGQYSNFTSPVSSRGKASDCPPASTLKGAPPKTRSKVPAKGGRIP